MTETLCWKCNTAYPIDDPHCPACGATNGNIDLPTAIQELTEETKARQEARQMPESIENGTVLGAEREWDEREAATDARDATIKWLAQHVEWHDYVKQIDAEDELAIILTCLDKGDMDAVEKVRDRLAKQYAERMVDQ